MNSMKFSFVFVEFLFHLINY